MARPTPACGVVDAAPVVAGRRPATFPVGIRPSRSSRSWSTLTDADERRHTLASLTPTRKTEAAWISGAMGSCVSRRGRTDVLHHGPHEQPQITGAVRVSSLQPPSGCLPRSPGTAASGAPRQSPSPPSPAGHRGLGPALRRASTAMPPLAWRSATCCRGLSGDRRSTDQLCCSGVVGQRAGPCSSVPTARSVCVASARGGCRDRRRSLREGPSVAALARCRAGLWRPRTRAVERNEPSSGPAALAPERCCCLVRALRRSRPIGQCGIRDAAQNGSSGSDRRSVGSALQL